jgi:hypothetical protein
LLAVSLNASIRWFSTLGIVIISILTETGFTVVRFTSSFLVDNGGVFTPSLPKLMDEIRNSKVSKKKLSDKIFRVVFKDSNGDIVTVENDHDLEYVLKRRASANRVAEFKILLQGQHTEDISSAIRKRVQVENEDKLDESSSTKKKARTNPRDPPGRLPL